MSKTLVVNLFAGPGAGKSTTAAGLFFELKCRGINCEYLQEYAKRVVWGRTQHKLRNQTYVFGKQQLLQWDLKGQVEVIITDSPIPTSLFYIDKDSEDYCDAFPTLVMQTFGKYHNLNFYMERVKPYNPAGRYQDEAGAKQVDAVAHSVLEEYEIEHIHINGDRAGMNAALSYVLAALEGMKEHEPE